MCEKAGRKASKLVLKTIEDCTCSFTPTGKMGKQNKKAKKCMSFNGKKGRPGTVLADLKDGCFQLMCMNDGKKSQLKPYYKDGCKCKGNNNLI